MPTPRLSLGACNPPTDNSTALTVDPSPAISCKRGPRVEAAGGGRVLAPASSPLTKRVPVRLLERREVKRYTGIGNCFTRVAAEQGIASFWRGNLVNCMRYFPTQAFNFAFKDTIKAILPRPAKGDFGQMLAVNMASGGLAGAGACRFPSHETARIVCSTGTGAVFIHARAAILRHFPPRQAPCASSTPWTTRGPAWPPTWAAARSSSTACQTASSRRPRAPRAVRDPASPRTCHLTIRNQLESALHAMHCPTARARPQTVLWFLPSILLSCR